MDQVGGPPQAKRSASETNMTDSAASPDLTIIEAQIDDAFSQNALSTLPFAQSVWTLLSVVEDHHAKNMVFKPLAADQAAIFVDVLLNALTYPLRVCYQRGARGPFRFKRELVDEHYELANKWLESAEDYVHFCSIFPLYHAGEIGLRVNGKELIPTDWSSSDLSYEVYDRFVGKRELRSESAIDVDLVAKEIRTYTQVIGGTYSVNFTRRLMSALELALGTTLGGRYDLPENWQFSRFSLVQFRHIFSSLQMMAHAWFIARQIAVYDGAPAIAFASAVWTPKKDVLVATLARHTGIEKSVVMDVLRYLTFGQVGIRNPDIAIQPIVDLTNGQYAISPFVVTNVYAERNLSVLLNQIPHERNVYLQLVHEKEKEVRLTTIESLAGLGLDFRHGQLEDTDIDLAIIDHKTKKCLCVEIKWFIEPAEIREVLARSKELAKGVTQARKIAAAFHDNDVRLMALLGIDQSYEFVTMVGSVNFIGGHRVQHPEVPITKVWHLASEIRKRGGLAEVLQWLRRREYLPRKGRDYKITEVAIQSGEWRSRWYGITYAAPEASITGLI